MARRSAILSEELIEALRANGLVPEDTRRVVIDLTLHAPPILHVEKYGDRALLKVTEALAGVEVTRVESPSD